MDIDLNIIKVLIPWVVSFLFGLFITPIVLSYLYKFKTWRKSIYIKKEIFLEENRGEVSRIVNKSERDKRTPRMGGIVIVLAVLFTTFFFWLISFGIFGNVSGDIDFLSRTETWLPLAAFIGGALLGIFDDVFTIRNVQVGKFVGLSLSYRLVFVALFAFITGWWFYEKLGYSQINIPFYGNYELGILFIPFFIFVFTSVFATSNIDGLDGLAGGIMASVFTAMGFIGFYTDKLDISAFSFVVVGSVLAFLWFNVSPARFYMTEVGYNALSFSLVIIAFMTDTVVLLPILALPLFVTLVTTVMQVFSVRVFKKKIFKIAPLHHHFEALGWSESQIVFRYWIVTIISSILGVAFAIVSL